MAHYCGPSVYLAACGRYHTFQLSTELQALGALGGLFTVDKSVAPPRSVPRSKYHNDWVSAIRSRAGRYLPMLASTPNDDIKQFDNRVLTSLQLQEPGVLHGWHGHIYETFKVLKERAWRLCLERSCPYYPFQVALLEEESRRLSVPFSYDSEGMEQAIEQFYLADVISTCSTYSANSYNAHPDLLSKVRINSLGANVEIVESVPSGPPSAPRILMVGNNFLRKGIHYLSEGFTRYIRSPSAQLWIRGDVPRDYAATIKDSRITVLPPVSRKRLRRLYLDATVFCLPSIDEGFGMVVLEAIANGLPVVITDNVGCKDILDSRVCKVVAIRDPRALADGIEWAMEQPREGILAAARDIIGRNTWSECARRQVDLVYAG